MLTNTRLYLPQILASARQNELLPLRSNLSDIALLQSKGAIAFIFLLRPSHRTPRVDGYVGPVGSTAIEASNEQLPLQKVRCSHILNLDDLRTRAFLDEDSIVEGLQGFFGGLRDRLDRVARGGDLPGLRESARTDIFIGPELIG